MTAIPFTIADGAAFVFFVAAWLVYKFAVEEGPSSRRSLNHMMNEYRGVWMARVLEREQRIVDSSIMAALQNGTAFFASTSLIAMGGSLALLRSTDDVLRLIGDLPFAVPAHRLVWEVKAIGLVVIFGYAFFKFAWSYRLFNYTAILMGALPLAKHQGEPDAQRAVARAAAMSVAAARHFNRGQRAFFFALAYLGWFLSPYVLFVTTAAVMAAMWRRQFGSEARAALDAGDEA